MILRDCWYDDSLSYRSCVPHEETVGDMTLYGHMTYVLQYTLVSAGSGDFAVWP
jgi:hypothetical protein